MSFAKGRGEKTLLRIIAIRTRAQLLTLVCFGIADSNKLFRQNFYKDQSYKIFFILWLCHGGKPRSATFNDPYDFLLPINYNQ